MIPLEMSRPLRSGAPAPPLEPLLSLRHCRKAYAGIPPVASPLEFAEAAHRLPEARAGVRGRAAGMPGVESIPGVAT
jgi:hypothetical protein